MSNVELLKFTKEHEWVDYDGGTKVAKIGISDFAQGSLGDIVFVELPKVGAIIEVNKVIGSVESVKTVSDIYAPVGGEVVEVNGVLENHPEYVNQEPYGKGWMLKVRVNDDKDVVGLLSHGDYVSKYN